MNQDHTGGTATGSSTMSSMPEISFRAAMLPHLSQGQLMPLADLSQLNTDFCRTPFDLPTPVVTPQQSQAQLDSLVHDAAPTASSPSVSSPAAAAASAQHSPAAQPTQTASPSPQPGDAPARPRKGRREKPRIALAPDQPPTTQGKPRTRVFVACVQCRNRKIRCDGAKPVCHNCGVRTGGGAECSYDSAPKRRGPDKMPGGRQRTAMEDEERESEAPQKRRRRRTESEQGAVGAGRDGQEAEAEEQSRDQSQSGRASSSETLPSEDHPAPAPDPTSDPGPLLFTPFPLENLSNLPASLLATALPVPPPPDLPASPASGAQSGLLMPLVTDLDIALPPHLEDFDAEQGHLAKLLARPEPLAQARASYDLVWDAHMPTALLTPSTSFLASLFASPSADNDDDDDADSGPGLLPSQPSLDFSRKTWWDALLSLYTDPFSPRPLALAHPQRERATRAVAAELRFFFRSANNWLSFFHLPGFFAKFGVPAERERLQPALMLSLLTVATFFQSSEVGRGAEGRQRARRFADEAQSALEASINGGWIDEQLAQAAYLLALFEACPHPLHSGSRSVSSLKILDNIIRCLGLTFLDADEPTVCTFTRRTVPAVGAIPMSPSSRTLSPLLANLGAARAPTPDEADAAAAPLQNRRPGVSGSAMVYQQSLQLGAPAPPPAATLGCACAEYSLGHRWPPAQEHAPLWMATPSWDPAWGEAEIRKDGCRRLCWSTLQLVAGHSSVTSACGMGGIDLWVAEPSNFSLLLPGEALISSPTFSTLGPSSAKNSVWALYGRVMMLWQACLRMRGDPAVRPEEKARFCVQAWLEADRLDKALDRHTCGIERTYMYQGREYLFNTRMCISYEFQNYIPLANADVSGEFHRKMAEAWLQTEVNAAKRLMNGLHTVTGLASNVLARRPFFSFWFMAQVTRALVLWQKDNSLTLALDVCKAFLPPIEYLSELWPCPEQHVRYLSLHETVVKACRASGVPEPPPPPTVALQPAAFKR